MRTLAEVMTRDPVAVVDTAPLETAAVLMRRHHVRHLPVTDAAEGRLVGVVDDAAVFARGELSHGLFKVFDPRDVGLRVTDAAGPPYATAADAPLGAVLRAMVEDGRDAIVACDGMRRPMGIFTAHDAVRCAPVFLPTTATTRTLARRPVATVGRGSTVGAALDTMNAHRVRHVVVVDGDRPHAVVSWRDLASFEAALRKSRGLDALGLGLAEVVHDGATLLDVADKMVAQKIGLLPIVDPQGRMVGAVSRSDLMEAIAARIGTD